MIDGAEPPPAIGLLWFRVPREPPARRSASRASASPPTVRKANGRSLHPSISADGPAGRSSRAPPPTSLLAARPAAPTTYVHDRPNANTTLPVTLDYLDVAGARCREARAPVCPGARPLPRLRSAFLTSDFSDQIFVLHRDADGNGILDQPWRHQDRPHEHRPGAHLRLQSRAFALSPRSRRTAASWPSSPRRFAPRHWIRNTPFVAWGCTDRDSSGDGLFESIC